ncbi:ROK family protein [Nocardia goodfellowii]|uniref:NBD/HSP70 family sugar kinase n=1 Tax=Nocardia goodfellowii TaxID=882446 RepID=A0ABS4QK19_9NOCA|nr:ROK family protein [Nocardia goodfellowii]MBP2192046.1 putative NBD/HSP70 family sugar kinase [Nocardia goodfellowii]
MSTATNSGHLQQVRLGNLCTVLLSVVDRPGSRAELAQRIGLTKATVASLIEPLLAQQILIEDAATTSGRGRPSKPLRFHPAAPIALGAEINVGYLAVTATGLDGTVLSARHVEVDNRRRSAEDLAGHLIELIADDEASRGRRVFGAGVAVPGIVVGDTVVRAPNVPGLTGARLADHLRAGLGIDLIEVDNEANLAALAHVWPHKLAGDDFLYVSGDVGIGGGLVTGGTLYRGVSGFAGELGHITIEREGRRCRCGSTGCVEQYAGLDAILSDAGQDNLQALTSALADGDPGAQEAVARAGSALGVGLASVLNICDLATVVLGGCYAEIFETLAPALGTELQHRTLAAGSRPITVIAAPVRGDAAVRGGAALVARRACTEPERLMRL